MDAVMAFLSILAIIAIVLVTAVVIAFIGHMIIGIVDNDKQPNSSKEVIDYAQYKQLKIQKLKKRQMSMTSKQ